MLRYVESFIVFRIVSYVSYEKEEKREGEEKLVKKMLWNVEIRCCFSAFSSLLPSWNFLFKEIPFNIWQSPRHFPSHDDEKFFSSSSKQFWRIFCFIYPQLSYLFFSFTTKILLCWYKRIVVEEKVEKRILWNGKRSEKERIKKSYEGQKDKPRR